MIRIATLCAAILAVTGCTADLRNRALADGQLVCGLGPANAVAMVDPAGAPIFARGNTAMYVAAVCAAINAIPVSPPAQVLPIATVIPPVSRG